MENTNTDKQPSQIKRNPTRFNTNVKEGKTDEKNLDAQTGQNRDFEINPAELDNDEINLDRSGIDTTPGNKNDNDDGGEETRQADGQVDGESDDIVDKDFGMAPERETESEISHKGQAGGLHASSMGRDQKEALDKNPDQIRRPNQKDIKKDAHEVQKQAAKPGQGQTYGQKDREKIPNVDQEGRIEDQNSLDRGMDQNRNGNQQGSQFNQLH